MLNHTNKSKLGVFGEEIAIKYLIKNGYKILARNYLLKADEIDIIAKQGDGTLVFCEAKTMMGFQDPAKGLMPEDNITAFKYKKMARAAQTFANKYPGYINEEKGWRMDLIAIVLDEQNNVADLRHYENV